MHPILRLAMMITGLALTGVAITAKPKAPQKVTLDENQPEAVKDEQITEKERDAAGGIARDES